MLLTSLSGILLVASLVLNEVSSAPAPAPPAQAHPASPYPVKGHPAPAHPQKTHPAAPHPVKGHTAPAQQQAPTEPEKAHPAPVHEEAKPIVHPNKVQTKVAHPEKTHSEKAQPEKTQHIVAQPALAHAHPEKAQSADVEYLAPIHGTEKSVQKVHDKIASHLQANVHQHNKVEAQKAEPAHGSKHEQKPGHNEVQLLHAAHVDSAAVKDAKNEKDHEVPVSDEDYEYAAEAFGDEDESAIDESYEGSESEAPNDFAKQYGYWYAGPYSVKDYGMKQYYPYYGHPFGYWESKESDEVVKDKPSAIYAEPDPDDIHVDTSDDDDDDDDDNDIDDDDYEDEEADKTEQGDEHETKSEVVAAKPVVLKHEMKPEDEAKPIVLNHEAKPEIVAKSAVPKHVAKPEVVAKSALPKHVAKPEVVAKSAVPKHVVKPEVVAKSVLPLADLHNNHIVLPKAIPAY